MWPLRPERLNSSTPLVKELHAEDAAIASRHGLEAIETQHEATLDAKSREFFVRLQRCRRACVGRRSVANDNGLGDGRHAPHEATAPHQLLWWQLRHSCGSPKEPLTLEPSDAAPFTNRDEHLSRRPSVKCCVLDLRLRQRRLLPVAEPLLLRQPLVHEQCDESLQRARRCAQVERDVVQIDEGLRSQAPLLAECLHLLRGSLRGLVLRRVLQQLPEQRRHVPHLADAPNAHGVLRGHLDHRGPAFLREGAARPALRVEAQKRLVGEEALGAVFLFGSRDDDDTAVEAQLRHLRYLEGRDGQRCDRHPRRRVGNHIRRGDPRRRGRSGRTAARGQRRRRQLRRLSREAGERGRDATAPAARKAGLAPWH
mmetsp:Transcript_66973/g.186999  ORF Transcript_66973/g.186999 Transcript_66973/m.186999 type:complete len:369 (-) Transcript_66973:109-1215(-)